MGSLIDTSIFVAAERGRLDLPAVLSEIAGDPVQIAAVTAAELLHGVLRADAAHRDGRRAVVEGILHQFPVAPFDMQVARTYAALLADRSAAGKPLAAHDLMIAATALTLGYRIVTRDARSFPTIAGLDVMLR